MSRPDPYFNMRPRESRRIKDTYSFPQPLYTTPGTPPSPLTEEKVREIFLEEISKRSLRTWIVLFLNGVVTIAALVIAIVALSLK